jgi:hypothetical protein
MRVSATGQILVRSTQHGVLVFRSDTNRISNGDIFGSSLTGILLPLQLASNLSRHSTTPVQLIPSQIDHVQNPSR